MSVSLLHSLIERFHGMEEVDDSSPLGSSV
jgi:hypothetical protein